MTALKKYNTDLIGSFVFIYQGDGILSSIYMNTGHTEPHPETAKRIGDREKKPIRPDNFDGYYQTIWLERGPKIDKTKLDIELLDDGTYQLKWFEKSIIYYRGVGFLRNGELIGAYWETDK